MEKLDREQKKLIETKDDIYLANIVKKRLNAAKKTKSKRIPLNLGDKK